MSRVALALGAVVSSIFSMGTAFAAEQMPTPSFPTEWQLGIQTPATPQAEMLHDFHTLLLWIITTITVFVAILLLICIFRFNEKSNPVPAKWSHNTLIEVIWTIVPVFILVGIAVPSYRILYYLDHTTEAEMTLKITGNQWFWSYEYPDSGVSFDAIAVPDAEIDVKAGQHRLLETDRHVILPVDTNIRLLFTANDVIHAWTIPAFGVKLDNMPGRVNETWTRITKPGRYYGQCSELCGVDHSFMPIVVDAVSKEEYQRWVEQQKAGLTPATADSVKLASAQ
ncbi:MAG: cytochrome c oxidase subunit II [Proteobacteria bacterium]|nr:cytochrome c oxidase subunit II [Pseudomonadota bacterium]